MRADVVQAHITGQLASTPHIAGSPAVKDPDLEKVKVF
jgi:hypothetical protein